jgi:hypothetical protein
MHGAAYLKQLGIKACIFAQQNEYTGQEQEQEHATYMNNPNAKSNNNTAAINTGVSNLSHPFAKPSPILNLICSSRRSYYAPRGNPRPPRPSKRRRSEPIACLMIHWRRSVACLLLLMRRRGNIRGLPVLGVLLRRADREIGCSWGGRVIK